jgi:hypothetical protein
MNASSYYCYYYIRKQEERYSPEFSKMKEYASFIKNAAV